MMVIYCIPMVMCESIRTGSVATQEQNHILGGDESMSIHFKLHQANVWFGPRAGYCKHVGNISDLLPLGGSSHGS